MYAYHTYPGYGQNLNPESMDYGAYLNESPRALRDLVTHYPGIKPDIPFFDDEFNSIPSWMGSDESVQAKYVPRGFDLQPGAGVKTFVWLLAAGADGNEYDDFGIIHGITNHDTDFTPRPVFYALQNTNALFADTKFDASIEIAGPDLPALRRQTGFPFMTYGFRSNKGKAIVAYWMAAHSLPGNSFPPLYTNLSLKNTGITHPVLVDVSQRRNQAGCLEAGNHRHTGSSTSERQHHGGHRRELFRLAGASGSSQFAGCDVGGRCSQIDLASAWREHNRHRSRTAKRGGRGAQSCMGTNRKLGRGYDRILRFTSEERRPSCLSSPSHQ